MDLSDLFRGLIAKSESDQLKIASIKKDAGLDDVLNQYNDLQEKYPESRSVGVVVQRCQERIDEELLPLQEILPSWPMSLRIVAIRHLAAGFRGMVLQLEQKIEEMENEKST